jgi:hypothetical protein
MPNLNTPLSLLALHEHQQALLDCVCESMDLIPVELPGFLGCPCRKFVSPGQPAADACDGGCEMQPGDYPGQLTVHINRMFATDYQTFPRRFSNAIGGAAAVRDLKGCALPQVNALDLYVTVFRCIPGPTAEGCPPSGEALSAVSMQLSADMLAVQRAVACCYPATDTEVRRSGRRYAMGDTNMIGPSGGCIGFRTEVTVAIDGCLPCPPEPPPVGP